MNKTELRETARDIITNRNNFYYSSSPAEDEEKESNGLSIRQNKILSNSENYEKDVKRKYGELISKIKEKKVSKKEKKTVKKKRFNYMGFPAKYIPLDEITPEMEEKEEEWGIEYGEYLHDKK